MYEIPAMKKIFTLRSLVFLAMLVLSTIYSIQVVLFDKAYLYGENELMEHTQLLILVLVGIAFSLQVSAKNWTGTKSFSSSLSLLALLGAALSFSFIVREMSVKKSEIDWLIYIVDGQGYKIFMALIWLPLLYKAFQYKAEYIELIKKGIFSPTSLLLMAAVAFLGGGALFDKEVIVVEYFRFYEEVLEMNGYGFMLLAALSLRNDMVQLVSEPK